LLWATPSKVIADTAQLLDDLFAGFTPILFEKTEISEYCWLWQIYTGKQGPFASSKYSSLDTFEGWKFSSIAFIASENLEFALLLKFQKSC
jgi:hypothetical protein